MTPVPWTVELVKAVSSSTWNDYVLPTGGAAPITVTFGSAGADDPRVFFSGGLPTSITVAGNTTDLASGATDIPRITWSDWCPLPNQPADPNTGMRVVMLRALTLVAQTETYVNGTWSGYSGGNGGSNTVNRGYDVFVGGYNSEDRVTTPFVDSSATPAAYIGNLPGNGSIFAVVQALTKNEGVTICQLGESKYMGPAFLNWTLRSVGVMGSATIGKLPIGYCNAAVGGYDSAHTFGLARTLLPAVRPSIVNIPSYNGNENLLGLGYTDFFSQQVQYARTMEFLDFVRSIGAVPILPSPVPFVAADGEQLPFGPLGTPANPGFQAAFTAWKAFTASSGVPIFDIYSILGSNAHTLDPRYGNRAWSDDGNHASDAGHALLVQPYIDLILPILGIAVAR